MQRIIILTNQHTGKRFSLMQDKIESFEENSDGSVTILTSRREYRIAESWRTFVGCLQQVTV